MAILQLQEGGNDQKRLRIRLKSRAAGIWSRPMSTVADTVFLRGRVAGTRRSTTREEIQRPALSCSDRAVDERDLGHVDAAAAEAALAIHQVIAPQIVEARVEAGGEPARRDRLVVAAAPALQRLGIMEAVADAVAPFEAGRLGEAAEAGLADQQAAGKDVGLNEVGIGGVAVRTDRPGSRSTAAPPCRPA